MSKSYVDANYRFIAANQEVNARIVQRQQALALYVTLVVSLLAALVALRPGAGAEEPPIEWLLLGFPVASLCLALLNYKAERAISNLRTFLSELERLDNAHQTLPSYNTEPRWAKGANKARRFHDFATTMLAAGGNAIGLGAAWKIYPLRLGGSSVFLYGSVLLALASLAILLLTPQWSYSPDAADR
ncbi:hypothetical protein J2X19_004606 [Rhodoferax ferrireducens]|uniref:SMODS and SLOG-associating 2TM effector domain-containing protein n=1 Tax=Rhodoferax ferrireducens TaxID=192843 RepID=A0ABU2CEY2_9BURK|nr:hypothetical protein [Rhodoferax ferrireducens]MDR7379910.1 hypothetical protein [Rhodoferax ferrireducens]